MLPVNTPLAAKATKGESFNSIHDHEREPTDGPTGRENKAHGFSHGFVR